jgi:uncharacterized protein
MRFLLDVSSLIALGLDRHQFHDRVVAWARLQHAPSFLTCSITEIGFVRVLAQVPGYGLTVPQARNLLVDLKKSRAWRIEFISDGNDISCLPNWVKSAKQTTDGHLVELAKAQGAVLATLDMSIPGAYVIPE